MNNGNKMWRTVAMAAICVGLLNFAGCGSSNIGRVTGQVTLDGQPLPSATVEFQPAEGSPSYGITDSSGYYALMYLPDQPGAEVGSHQVRVTTYDWVTNSDGSKQEVPEKVPAIYNVETQLTFEVEAGSQSIDIVMTSEP